MYIYIYIYIYIYVYKYIYVHHALIRPERPGSLRLLGTRVDGFERRGSPSLPSPSLLDAGGHPCLEA